jgi:hypothetical protein
MRMSDFRVVDANGVELRVGQWIGPADCPGEIIAINEPEGDYSYELERFVAVGGGVILRGVEERFGIWSTARGPWDDASEYRAEDLELLGDGSEPAEDGYDDVPRWCRGALRDLVDGARVVGRRLSSTGLRIWSCSVTGPNPPRTRVDDVDVEYERAQASEAWERRGGGGL